MSFIIRRMAPADIDAILEIEALSFRDPWSRESMIYETQNAAALYFVGIETGHKIFGQEQASEKIIAYAGLWTILDEGHITNVAVHPGYRGQGRGLLLVSKMIEEAGKRGSRHFTLEVKTTNTAAITLYEKLGFKVEGVRPNYYQYDKSDAYIMWKRGG